MRINVYSEEMGEPVTIIRKDGVNATDANPDGETFFGLRIWLKSPKELLEHSTPEDDDRNAVTFWSRDLDDLQEYAEHMLDAVIDYKEALSREQVGDEP